MKIGLKSKHVLTPEGMKDATVVIEDEKIINILSYESPLNFEVEDFGDLYIMPGLVDTHVHINEPGRTDWEGFETATKAAAAGGITTLVDMPLNSSPVTTDTSALNKKIKSSENKLYVDCGFYGGLITDNINELESLIENGVLGIKAFMVHSGIDEFPNVNENDLRRALALLSQSHVAHFRNVPHVQNVPYVPLLVHAEINCGFDISNDHDEFSFKSFLETRPREWENKAIKLLINLCSEFKYPIHIVHLSSSDAIDMIKEAKEAGLPITVETCPHYLFFCSEEISNKDTKFKCTPPIRESNNKEKLWDAVKDGSIDFIVSDHSPCSPELKCLDKGSFQKAWGGISSLQFSLPAVWTQARKRGFTILEISKLMSTKTASFISLEKTKGKIEKGSNADIVVFDPNEKFVVEEKNILHKHKVTPYLTRELYGVVKTTFLRGKKVFDREKIISEPIGKIILGNNQQIV